MRLLLRMGGLLASASLTLNAAEWTEQEVIRQFLDQSPIVRETRARVAIADAETRGRTLWANPTAGISREGAGRTEFYQLSQALPLSGRFPFLRQAGALQRDVLDAEGAFQLWSARCTLRTAFYRALASQFRQRLWQDSGRELARMIDLLAQREKEGEGSRLDRLRAEREQVELLASARLADADWEQYRGDVLVYLPDFPANDTFAGSLDAAFPEGDSAAWIAKAMANRPDLQAERRRVDQLRREQLAADRLRLPDPVVNAGLKRADLGLGRIDAGPVVGVSLAIPSFNKGKTEVARYAAEQERVAARLDQMSRRVRAAVQSAWRSLEARRDARDRYTRSQAESTAELIRVTTVAYQEGEIGILQLLDAYRVQRESRLRQIDLALAVKEAQIALEAQVGEEFGQ